MIHRSYVNETQHYPHVTTYKQTVAGNKDKPRYLLASTQKTKKRDERKRKCTCVCVVCVCACVNQRVEDMKGGRG